MSLLFLLGAGKWMVQGLRAFLGPVKALPDVRGFTIKSLRDGMELGWPEIKGHLTGRLWDPTMPSSHSMVVKQDPNVQCVWHSSSSSPHLKL